MIGQVVRYLVVGASNTAITLAGYAALVAAGVPPVVASGAAFGAGALNGYRLNRAWTFRSDRRGARTGARYVLVAGWGVGLNAAGVALAVGVAGLPRLAAEVPALPAATATTFLLARSWVFGSAGGRGSRGAAAPPRG